MKRKSTLPVCGRLLRRIPGITFSLSLTNKRNGYDLQLMLKQGDFYQAPPSPCHSDRTISDCEMSPTPTPQPLQISHRDAVEQIVQAGFQTTPTPGICQICSSKKTGQWRKGPCGPRTLCNGCGLAYVKRIKVYASAHSLSYSAAEKQFIAQIKIKK